MSQTITVPDSLVQAVQFVDRNSTAIIGVLAVVLLASIVTEVIKRKFLKGHYAQLDIGDAEKKLKKAVAWVLAASATVFTALGYTLFLLEPYKSVISQVPYIGEGALQAIGLAYLAYNFRLNHYYSAFATWAAKFSKTSTAPSLPQPAEPTPAPADELV